MPDDRCKITRTQSSLAPIVHQSSNQIGSSEDLHVPQGDDQEALVHIVIQNGRILVIVAGMAFGLGMISSVMIRGVSLPELSANALTDTDKSKLLDRYNTYTGAFFSALSLPFQQIVTLFMPVFFLCFVTSAIISTSKSVVERWAPTCVTLMVSLLVGQGMNAVNVQFDSPRIEFIIGSSDLSSINSVNYPFVVTNVTNSARIAGIPSTDTILRNAIQSSASIEQSTCQWPAGWADRLDPPEASIRFGFPLNSWLEYLLPESVESEKTFSFSVNDSFQAGSINSSVLPDWPLGETTKLFSYGISLLMTHYSTEFLSPADVYDSVSKSDPAQMLTDMQGVIQNEDKYWTNISVPEITVQFSNFNLSPQIQFNAVTFELPVEMETMQRWVHSLPDYYTTITKSGSGYYTEFLTRFVGNEHALGLTSPATFHDQVRLVNLCVTKENGTVDDMESFIDLCDYTSKSSVLVYSFAQHVAMDEVELFKANDDYTTIRMKNLRKVYSATIGKLTWQTSNLTQVYDATCEIERHCNGLYFPLSNGHQHVVVGETHIPTVANTHYYQSVAQLQVLVAAKNELIAPVWFNVSAGTRYHLDLIYPPIHPATSESLPWNVTQFNCSLIGSGFINDVIQRHLYSKDPVQPAYTAGLFWLFQNAALHNIQNYINSSEQTAVKLDFHGNLHWISPRVSMPRTSAFMTIASCILILIGGVVIHFWSRNEKKQSEFQQQLQSAHTVGNILFNAVQFPPLLLHSQIQQSIKQVKTCSDSNYDLRSHTITEITLCNQQTPEHTVRICSSDANEVQI